MRGLESLSNHAWNFVATRNGNARNENAGKSSSLVLPTPPASSRQDDETHQSLLHRNTLLPPQAWKRVAIGAGRHQHREFWVQNVADIDSKLQYFRFTISIPFFADKVFMSLNHTERLVFSDPTMVSTSLSSSTSRRSKGVIGRQKDT